MTQSRFYSSTAQATVLTSSVTPSSTTIIVQQTVGFPVNTPYILALDYNSASEEIVLVTAAAGTSLTVTRAYDGTSATSHNAGAAVRHTWTAADGNDSRSHEGSSTGVHGVTGNIVGDTATQTLTNKTLTSPVINSGTLNGTYAGNPTFSGTVTVTAPTINGTVGGTPTFNGATDNNPNITGTVTGKATYRTITGQPAVDADQCIILKRISATQTGNILSMQDETGASLGFISPSGAARWRSGLNGGSGDAFSVSSGGVGTWTIQSPASKGLSIKGAVTQSANLQDWQNSSGTVLSSIDSVGVSHNFTGLKAGSSDQFSVDATGKPSSSTFTSTYVQDSTSGTTSSTSYVDITPAQSTTVVVPPSGKVFVSGRASLFINTTGSLYGVLNVVGSTSGSLRASTDANAVRHGNGTSNDITPGTDTFIITGVAGETLTIKWQFRVTAGTGQIDYRSITAYPMIG